MADGPVILNWERAIRQVKVNSRKKKGGERGYPGLGTALRNTKAESICPPWIRNVLEIPADEV